MSKTGVLLVKSLQNNSSTLKDCYMNTVYFSNSCKVVNNACERLQFLVLGTGVL